MPSDRWLPFGKLGRAHGVRGELRFYPFNPESPLLGELADVRLEHEDGRALDATVRRLRAGGKAPIISIEGITGRDRAAEWTNAQLLVPAAAVPELDEAETFYAFELEGAEVRDGDGAPLGTIHSVENFGAGDILVVERAGDGELMIPFQERYVPSVALDDGYVVVAHIDELE